MGEIDPPSFSLGLDFDLDLHLNSGDQDPHPPTLDPYSAPIVEDSDLDEPAPSLRRLRRGPGPSTEKQPDAPVVDDDDIEEFSSLDGFDGLSSVEGAHQHSLRGSSKLSLTECGVFARQTVMGASGGKRKQTSYFNGSLDSRRNTVKFPKPIKSPIRRFQLLDSDSDDDVVEINRNGNSMEIFEQTVRGHDCSTPTCEPSSRAPQTMDPWEHFSPDIPSVPTPALDSFCEEYFRRAHGSNTALNSVHGISSTKLKTMNEIDKKGKHMDSGYALPPAHCYFFHEEPKIRELVRSRLPHFFPLTAANDTGFQQQDESIVDYRSQFSNGGVPKKQDCAKVYPKSSGKACAVSRKSKAEKSSSAFGNWVDPKQQSIPKDAGRRRVHADGQYSGSGHWYTDESGIKVYVSRNGQQLTGQIAYRQYKKDSGARFRRSKKKSATKKKVIG